jgi:hypothetical protein
MSFTDTFTAVPDQVLDAITTTQDLFLSTVQAIAETAKPLTEKLPAPPFADQLPNPVTLLENAFATAEKFLASQRDFSVKLIEAYLPAKSGAKPAAKTTTKVA